MEWRLAPVVQLAHAMTHILVWLSSAALMNTVSQYPLLVIFVVVVGKWGYAAEASKME